uniref:Reverse transcriptase domain-containing protein n=1 Tax=Clytia hemisphaerica TaxID=252671 RepID=A0A7M5VBW5_9CNID
FDLDPNKCFNIFNDKMKVLVDRHVPTVRLTKREVQSKLKPWITPGIVKSMSKRDFFQRKSLKSKNQATADHFDSLYRTYRNQIVNLSKLSKKNYYTSFFQRYSNNMKKVWSGIRDIISSKTQNNSNISISIDGQIQSKPDKVANHFNNFFTSIADDIRDKIPPSYQHFSSFLKHRNQNSIFLRPTSSDEVAKIIGSFSSSKSSGPNSIPIKILKILQDKISKPLSILINRSYHAGVFPEVLKISKVIPVFKNKGSPLDVSNYRPISLLSNIEKIYEKIMYSRVVEFLNQFNQIYSRQFGFRKGHSTTHTLMNILERIREHLDGGGFACGVFVDLQKAFDTVDHEILISKLDHYGIRGNTKAWFKSYLSDRSQYVSISGTNSNHKPIKHGVPQGSVLGPLLFLVYINDLHYYIRTSETYHFADDTHLLNLSQTVWSLCGRVNSDLRVLVSWLNANKISLNASKTEFIIFRSNRRRLDTIPKIEISGKRLTPSKTIKYLGVHLDEHLSWKQHVAVVAAKLRRANGAISKLRHYLPLPNLINVYHAIFSSHIRYACQTWGLCDNTVTHRIQVLQNTAIRIMTFQEPRASVTPTYNELKILKFFDLVETLNIMFIYRYLNRYLPSDCLSTFTFSIIPHDIGTRANHISLLFIRNVNTTTFGLHSLTRLASRQWNNLQEHLDDKNLQIIEPLDLLSHIHEFYLNKYAPQE